MMTFLRYERFPRHEPDFEPRLNWPLIVVAFALAAGILTALVIAFQAARIWLLGP